MQGEDSRRAGSHVCMDDVSRQFKRQVVNADVWEADAEAQPLRASLEQGRKAGSPPSSTRAKGCVCTIVDDIRSARTRKPVVLLVSQSRTERRAPLQLLLLHCCFFASFVLAFCTFAVEFTDAKVTFEPSFQLTRCRTCTTRATALTSGTRLVLCAPQRPDLPGAQGLIGLPRSGTRGQCNFV